MNRRLALLIALAATPWFVRSASAQGTGSSGGSGQGQGEVTIGYQGLPYKSSGESQTGIQLSEGVLMHVGAGAEAGYDSNVFYQSGPDPRGAAMFRTSLFADASNATRTGQVGRLSFNMRAGVTYRRYQSDDAAVQEFSNAWMPTAALALSMASGQVGFGIADTFVRLEDPPYDPNQPPITRYNNQGSAELRWAPGGGRLTATLRYINMLDWIEGTYSYATSMTNSLMLDASWKWLPKTAIFLNVTQGIVSYLETDTMGKVPSYPLRITTGLRGLLTEKTSILFALGYTNAFYSNGAVSTGGFWGSTFADLSLTVRPTMLSRAVLGFRHAFENSVISQFYYAETAYASYVQQIAGRLALDLSGRYVYKNYQGLLPSTGQAERADNFFQVGATLDYFVRNWIYAGVGYALLVNRGDVVPLPGMPQQDVDYTKQQVFLRLGITY